MSQTKAQLLDGSVVSVAFSAGSAAEPSLYFAGDTNTGLYSLGADQLAISTGGTGRLFVDANGRIIVGAATAAIGNPVEIVSNSSGLSIGVRGRSSDNIGIIGFYPNNSATEYARIQSNGDSSISIGTGSSGSERLRITAAGLVGIGTTSPVDALSVRAGTDANFHVRPLSGLGLGAGIFIDSLVDGAAAVTALGFRANQYLFRSSAGEFARIDTSGRLLVGTSTARSNFFNTTATSGFQVEGTGENAYLSIVQNNTSTAVSPFLILARSKGASVGSNTAVASGDALGVLSYQGNDGTEFVEAARITAEVDGTPGANDMPGRLVFSTTADGAASTTEAVRITSSQDLMISQSGSGIFVGTTVDGAFRIGRSSFAVSTGTLYIGNAAIQVSSDIRLKDNIEDTSLDALEAISKIKVKDYTWNDPSDTSYNNRNARGKWTGLIAQELVEILPFVVNAPRKEADGSIDHESQSTWTLDQSQLCPVLIKAVQQQQEIISSLESRIAALEGA